MRSACLLALAAAAASCAPRPRRVAVRPAVRDERGVTFLPFASSSVERFSDADGQPCATFAGHVYDNLLGWEARNADDAACTHDTLYEGTRAGTLEMRWSATLPADGSYDLVALGYSVGAWGRVVSRGSYYGDYWARAQVVIEASSPHCAVSWSADLAQAKVTGPQDRMAAFSGWLEIPELAMRGCKANEPIDVRLRLVGEANRGKIEVDWFGFSAVSDDEVHRIFGVRPKG
ncbi:MAG: hypothetical protein ACXWLR_03925 [Myxococcales bacterium]